MSIEYVNPPELNDEESQRLEIGHVEPNEKLGALAAKQSGDIVVSPELFSLAFDSIDLRRRGPSCDLPDAVDDQEVERMIHEIEDLLDRPRRARLAELADLVSRSETVIDDRFAHEPTVSFRYY